MKLVNYYIILLLFFCEIESSFAQSDTLLHVPEIEIQSFKIREESVGSIKILWDNDAISKYPTLNLGDFLQRNSNVYLKTFGGNGLATLSIRGSSASQNLVLWNGLPIQSSKLGLLDLSLIPTHFSNKISLLLGGNTASWGSGAVGGLLALENVANFNESIHVNYTSSLGSFGNLHQKMGLQLGNQKVQSHTQFSYLAADNDFRYKPLPSLPSKIQSNAAFKQLAFMQSFYANLTSKHQLNFHVWGQTSYKEIPALLTQRISLAQQDDESLRSMLHWQFINTKQIISAKAAYFIENQNFVDPIAAIDAQNNFATFLGEFSYQRKLKKQQLIDLTSSNQYTKASSNSYKNEQSLLRAALLLSYSLTIKKLHLQTSIREEWADESFLTPTPYLGMSYILNKTFKLRTKVSRDYRLPTLNDRFWAPGGNPDLKAEQGWSEEVGFDVYFQKNKHFLTFSSTAYNRNMKDWIIWKPSNASSFWEASNVAKVWSRGIETSFSYEFNKNKWRFSTNVGFTFNRSSYQIQLKLPAINKGDQLFYTPKFQGNLYVLLAYNKFSFNYQHLWVSESFGANEAIPAYHVANIFTNYQFQQARINGSLFLAINNIYNASYQVVERRPMAGTNYQIGMQIHFIKQKK